MARRSAGNDLGLPNDWIAPPKEAFQRAAKAPKPGRPVDILRAVKGMGGIKPSPELRAVGAHRVPGLLSNKGMPADRMREALAEAGYLDHLYGNSREAVAQSTPGDLYEMLDNRIKVGQRYYPLTDHPVETERASDRERFADARGEVVDALKRHGIFAEDDPFLDQAADLLQRGEADTPELAYEAAVNETVRKELTDDDKAAIDQAWPGFFEGPEADQAEGAAPAEADMVGTEAEGGLRARGARGAETGEGRIGHAEGEPPEGATGLRERGEDETDHGAQAAEDRVWARRSDHPEARGAEVSGREREQVAQLVARTELGAEGKPQGQMFSPRETLATAPKKGAKVEQRVADEGLFAHKEEPDEQLRLASSAPARKYPLAPRSEWYGEANFETNGGKIVEMSPDEFLAHARPLQIDESSRDNINDLKRHIRAGRTLDPLALYENGKEDGRHRANAAKELGITKVPVIVFRHSLASSAPAKPLGAVDYTKTPPTREGESVDDTGHYDLGEFPAKDGEPLGAQAQAAVLELGRRSGREFIVAIDAGGKTRAFGWGAPDATGLPDALDQAMRDPGAQVVVHHNHPSGAALSIPDLTNLAYPGMHAVWAHGHDGSVYRATLTKDGLARLGSKNGSDIAGRIARLHSIVNGADKMLGDVEHARVDGVFAPRNPSVQAALAREATVAHADLVARVLDEAGVIEYRSNADHEAFVARLDLRRTMRQIARSIRREFYNDGRLRWELDRQSEPLRHRGDVGALYSKAQLTAPEYRWQAGHDRPRQGDDGNEGGGGSPTTGEGFKEQADRRRRVAPEPRIRLAPDEREALQNDLKSIVSRIAGRKIEVRFDRRITLPGHNSVLDQMRRAAESSGTELLPTVGGLYDRYVNGHELIRLALNDPSYDPRTVAGHEAWHAVWEVMTPEEQRIFLDDVDRGAQSRLRKMVAAEYGMKPDDPYVLNMPHEEIGANAFQRYRRMNEEERGTGIHIALRRAFDRILRMLRQIVHMLRMRGILRPEDIFEEARTGGFAERERPGREPPEPPVDHGPLGASLASSTRQIDTPEFKRWFGKSKVVDAEGAPLIVYRGLPEGVYQDLHGMQFWTDAEAASDYADGSTGSVTPSYLHIEKPFDLTNDAGARRLAGIVNDAWEPSVPYWEIIENQRDDVLKSLAAKGYDGIKLQDANGRIDHVTYVTFRPEQVKSAISNSGGFNPTNPNMLASSAPRRGVPPEPPKLTGKFITETEDRLYAIDKNRQADEIELTKVPKKLPLDALKRTSKEPRLFGRKMRVSEVLYHHWEDQSGIPLTDAEKAILDKVRGLKTVETDLFNAVKKFGLSDSELALLRPDYMHRILTDYDRKLSKEATESSAGELTGGTDANPVTAGGHASRSLSKRAPSQRPRRLYVMDDGKGHRVVIQQMRDGIYRWQDGKPEKIKGFKIEGDLKPGKVFRMAGRDDMIGKESGRTWTVKDARTQEIEANTPYVYQKDFVANTLVNIYQLRQVLARTEFLDWLTKTPEFAAQSSDRAGGAFTERVDVPVLRDLYLTRDMAAPINDYLRGGPTMFDADIAEKLSKVNRLAIGSLFWQPFTHQVNELSMAVLARGFDNLNVKSTVVDGLRALRSVITQDEDYVGVLRNSGSLLSSGVQKNTFVERVMTDLGHELEKQPRLARAIAGELGVKVSDLVQAYYRGVAKVLWGTHDVLLMQRVFELERRGKLSGGPRLSRRQAIHKAERLMVDYRSHTKVAGSRVAARVLYDPNAVAFSRWHIGLLRAIARMAKDAVKPASGRDWLDNVGSWLAIAVLVFVVAPQIDKVAQALTGNKDATMGVGGIAEIARRLVAEMQKPAATRNMSRVTGKLLTGAPGTVEALEQSPLSNLADPLEGRDFFTGKPIGQGGPIQNITQRAEHALPNLVQPFEAVANPGRTVAQSFGISAPNPKSAANAAKYGERDIKAARKAAGKDPVLRFFHDAFGIPLGG